MNYKKIFLALVFLGCITNHQNSKAFNVTDTLSFENIAKTLDGNPWTLVIAGIAALWYIAGEVTANDKELAD